MGADGGSIPRRSELVKTKKAEEKPDADSQLQARWTTCKLSKEELKEPICACLLGNLYNKASILEYLLDKTAFGDADVLVSHIQSLKDIKALNLSKNPLANAKQSSAIYSQFQENVQAAPFVCPITQKEMNGHSRFSYLWTCGCVFSEQALKEVNVEFCMVCSKKFTADDIILINPVTKEDLRAAHDRIELQKAQIQARRQEKKRKKIGDEKELRKRASKTQKIAVHSKILDQPGVNPNIVLPDLSALEKLEPSKAVATLYTDKKNPTKATWINIGNFNRYG